MSEASRELMYADISVGAAAAFEISITPELVDHFAEISGDMNPLHVDELYAAQTQFGKRVAHGMVVGALFSRLIGMHLPGKYSLYLSQSLKFHQPIFLGTQLVVEGAVMQTVDARRVVILSLAAKDATSGVVYVSGEAMVQLLK